MDSIVNLYASASGLWKKVAVVLPYIAGMGTLLAGAAGICNEVGHAANAGALLAIARGLPNDPNAALIAAGLAALGLHAQHQAVKAAVANAAAVPLLNAPK